MRNSRRKQKGKNQLYIPERQAWGLYSYQAEYIAAGLRTFIGLICISEPIRLFFYTKNAGFFIYSLC